MRYVGMICITGLLLAQRPAGAQRIPATVADAEAAGAAFDRAPVPASMPPAYHAWKFDGSSERRCVTPGPISAWPPSLRSGEIIVRRWLNLQANNGGNKLLWLPLHDPGLRATTVVVRGMRIGHPSDTLRDTIVEGAAHAVGRSDAFGFPTTIEFPAPGQWLLVTQQGHDWGCFLLDVAENVTSSKPFGEDGQSPGRVRNAG